MNETYFPHLESLIAARTGLHLRPRERETLRVTLAVRMAALHLPHPDAYRQLLQAGTLDAEREWEQLTVRLTNNESYFFRDKGQMKLLRERILPELIARNQFRRSLRLWSAGCSTGEEPYSLALLLEELLPQGGADTGIPWDIMILGTDIDREALQKAQRGRFGAWSFRTMEPEQRDRRFLRRGDEWEVPASSRALVTFGQCNLVLDSFPNAALGIYDMDLILCRNVFIYFAPDSVSRVLPKFARTLREGGYLMTGHAETQNQPVEVLQPRKFPESLVYQRVHGTTFDDGIREGRPVVAPVAASPPSGVSSLLAAKKENRLTAPDAQTGGPGNATTRPLPQQITERERLLAEAESRYIAGDYPGTIRSLEPLQKPVEARCLLLLAHAHANLGHVEEAATCCRRLAEAFPLASEPYELLAILAQEQGRYDDAKLLLKQALYLAPRSPSAYLELGALYAHEGDGTRARKMRVTALELLREMPTETAIGFFGTRNAREWRKDLQKYLAEGDAYGIHIRSDI